MNQFRRALAISCKDIESYYGKPPLITWGLLFPAVLILSLYVKDPATYLAIAPGVIAMTLLFGNTSMAAIVVTFEKRAGTFQRLLLAPLSMRTIILGKAASASAYGLASALALSLGLKLALGMPMVNPLIFATGLVLGAGCFSLLGLTAAVMVREVFEAMTLMNFFRFPILFVSGIFMPLAQLPSWLKPLALASPLTYVVELLQLGVTGQSAFATPVVPLLAGLLFLFASWLLAEAIFRRRGNA
ncbi:MAG: ABC transporter permease [Deltaproteobacteria bacterium]|nr:ABC transporter permease [Deltaproteobacteria bacterium]MBW1952976.1 ABC transporter permease [Deltaproteobacteria bacterium]MBW1987754.1 ABC transporter permease [Deltaproteobacteria bacterium]MBW2135731.1 ABC transporter permease [Deltaproteobacteria bacterium]